MSAPLAKILLGRTAPQLLAGLLYLGSGIGLSIVWLLRRDGVRATSLKRRDLPWLTASIVFGGVLAPLLLMVGLFRTPATTTSLLLNLEGVLTAMLAWFAFREPVDRRIAFGIATILAGGVVVSWQGDVGISGLLGPLAIAGACLAWAIDNNLTQKISHADPVQLTMLKGLVAGTVNAGLAISLGLHLPNLATLGAAMVLGFVCYGVSLTLFVLSLRYVGTARTGAYFSVSSFIGAVASLVVIHEHPSVEMFVGGALMAFGLWLHLTDQREESGHGEEDRSG